MSSTRSDKLKPIYALVDCNSFYVSCERIFYPYLDNKPVGVLSNNDGCLVALSKEMKELGIERGTPAFKIDHLIKKFDIHLFSSNYALYGDISSRVMKVLSQFSPEMEVYSIDEAFLSLEGIPCTSLTDYGKDIRRTIKQWIGMPTTVGIARTKTLAKLANKIAKKKKAYEGVFDLTDHPDLQGILEATPLIDIWGLGYRQSKKMMGYGIVNAWQFVNAPEKLIKKKLTIVGYKTQQELKGIPCIDMETDIKAKKNIVTSKSFSYPVSELEELEEAISTYCSNAVEKLRKQNCMAKQVIVFLTTNPFKNTPQYANYKDGSLFSYSLYTHDFIQVATRILRSIYKSGYVYKKVGIMIYDIIKVENYQPEIFIPPQNYDKMLKIMESIDVINSKLGKNYIQYGSNGINKTWSMKREKLGEAKTTSWEKLPRVKA